MQNFRPFETHFLLGETSGEKMIRQEKDDEEAVQCVCAVIDILCLGIYIRVETKEERDNVCERKGSGGEN